MTTVNLGVFNEIANNKADRDLRNVDLTKTDIVIEYQEPTEENDYTWYRLYASGWVEQGGQATITQNGNDITLPIEMANTNYAVFSIIMQNTNGYNRCYSCTTTAISMASSGGNNTSSWQVLGKADMTGHEVLPSKKEIDEYDHRVIAFQKPTAENSYTWYRKYADGWVEQGGYTNGGNNEETNISLPVVMRDIYYSLSIAGYHCNNARTTDTPSYRGIYYDTGVITARTTIGFTLGNGENITWQVSGMAAE